MKSAYVYLQLYKLFDEVTPLKIDCGMLCNKACCQGDDQGMLLFPGEENVYKLFSPKWAKTDKTDLTYTYNGKEYETNILFCSGNCDRYQRPLACRIFPLTPYLDKDGELEVIVDPRAKSICRISKLMNINEFDPVFVKNIHRAFKLLMKNKRVYAFLKKYSEYLDEYKRFFK